MEEGVVLAGAGAGAQFFVALAVLEFGGERVLAAFAPEDGLDVVGAGTQDGLAAFVGGLVAHRGAETEGGGGSLNILTFLSRIIIPWPWHFDLLFRICDIRSLSTPKTKAGFSLQSSILNGFIVTWPRSIVSLLLLGFNSHYVLRSLYKLGRHLIAPRPRRFFPTLDQRGSRTSTKAILGCCALSEIIFGVVDARGGFLILFFFCC